MLDPKSWCSMLSELCGMIIEQLIHVFLHALTACPLLVAKMVFLVVPLAGQLSFHF